MLRNDMNLKTMLEFEPDDELMAILPLNVIVYIKIILINEDKTKTYNDLRLLFNPSVARELNEYIIDLNKIKFYDFDAPDKFITIMELNAKVNYQLIHDCFEEILNKYQFTGDIVINFYTHNNNNQCLSLYNGLLTTKPLKTKTQER
ncbi:MAG: hypothetical protein SPI53_03835 [Erysipelotrichaceae bacterium]|nr:hypothetical protein [Erysipelotrichaceae bacterium]